MYTFKLFGKCMRKGEYYGELEMTEKGKAKIKTCRTKIKPTCQSWLYIKL